MVSEWKYINEKIDLSKIPRFNYKQLLDESLTSYITRYKHLDNIDIRNNILKKEKVRKYLDNNPQVIHRFIDNITNSINSRKAEQKTYEVRK